VPPSLLLSVRMRNIQPCPFVKTPRIVVFLHSNENMPVGMSIREYTYPAVLAHPYISQRACGTWFRSSRSGPLASETNNAESSDFSSRRKGFCKKRSAEFEDEHSENTRVRTGFFSRRHYGCPINISSHCV
jgi:hypothetical protein